METEYNLTWVLQRDYFIYLGSKAKHSLSDCILARKLPFVVPSIVLVNIEGGPEVMNEPGNRR